MTRVVSRLWRRSGCGKGRQQWNPVNREMSTAFRIMHGDGRKSGLERKPEQTAGARFPACYAFEMNRRIALPYFAGAAG